MHFLWGKVVLLLVAVVAVLQVIHLVLLSRLEARHNHQHARHWEYGVETTEKLPSEEQIKSDHEKMLCAIQQSSVLDSSGEFQIVNKVAHGDHLPPPRSSHVLEDVALVSQCSVRHLHHLVPLTERWQGPVSVAVFGVDKEIIEALRIISGIRHCFSSLMHNVSFHFVFPLHSMNLIQKHTVDPGGLTIACAQVRQNIRQMYSGTNYAYIGIQYPNNLLRNVARRNVQTEYMFLIDIDMLPNINLRSDFYKFAVVNRLFHESKKNDKTVYVVPAFEAKETVPIPKDKKELLESIEKFEVRPFYFDLCWKCQIHTDYETWQKEPPNSRFGPIFEVLWKDPWEPFFIARNTIPFYDERFRQYGFNRISQVCELHVAGYKFSVLNNAFLVHKGLKTPGSFHAEKDVDQERNRMLFRQFKLELKDRYPESSRRCY